MPNFYFQQHAGRKDKRGQCWLEDVPDIPQAWLDDMDSALIKSGIVPGRGDRITCPGGVRISRTGHYVAVFAFRPTPPGYTDHSGRTNGVVINALFTEMDSVRPGKSLKKVWDHPILKSPPRTGRQPSVLIALDENMGDSEAEKSFFIRAANFHEDGIIPYSGKSCATQDAIEIPKAAEDWSAVPPRQQPQQRREEKTMSERSVKTDPQTEKTRSPGGRGFRIFCWGVLTGILLCGGVFVYYKFMRPSEQPSADPEIKLEFPLEKLKKEPDGYHIPLVLNIIEDKEEKGRGKVIVRLLVEEGVRAGNSPGESSGQDADKGTEPKANDESKDSPKQETASSEEKGVGICWNKACKWLAQIIR